MEIHAENYRFYPLTMEKWSDFESLFGPRGASGGCWCMYWRVPRREFTKGQGEPFRQAMRGLVEAGTVPGLLAYDGRDAIGWISIGKREEFILLKQSRVLAPVDDEPVWSIVCFYIAKAYREKGLMLPLINAAVEYAAEHRAKIVEAYPMDPYKHLSEMSAYYGITPVFENAGFVEAARRSEHHPVMRKALKTS